MLLEFRVKNYLSFKDEVVFSMLADNSIKDLSNYFEIGKYKILQSAVIYGANASGKSNLIKALRFMSLDYVRFLVVVFDREEIIPFKLSKETEDKPSLFEITFMVKNENISLTTRKYIIFRYGFEIDRNKIHSEWLFARFTSQESRLFVRKGDYFKIGKKFIEGEEILKALGGKISNRKLFLSIISDLKGENAVLTNLIMNKFKELINLGNLNFFDLELFEKYKGKIIKAMQYADLNIKDLIIDNEKISLSENRYTKDIESNNFIFYSKPGYKEDLKSLHIKYDKDNKPIGDIKFDFLKEESAGTKKFFKIISFIIEALENGYTIFIDEFELNLHPNLCSLIISMFNSKKINKNNAQLIFTTHNTMFLNKRTFRRDQIYFIEKDKYGASDLYSLADFGERNDASYDKNYLMGKYGAVPDLSLLKKFFETSV